MSNPFAADWPKPPPPRSIVPVDSLIAQLDPERNYGTRTFEDVVAGIRAGDILILPPPEQGRQPVLRLAENGLAIKGSGAASLGSGSGQAQTALQARLVTWADEEGLEIAITRLREIILHAEPAVAVKALDITFKYAMPKAREAAPDDTIALALLDRLMATREARPITVYEMVGEQADGGRTYEQ